MSKLINSPDNQQSHGEGYVASLHGFDRAQTEVFCILRLRNHRDGVIVRIKLQLHQNFLQVLESQPPAGLLLLRFDYLRHVQRFLS